MNAPASVVNDYIAPVAARHVPQMLFATTLVAVLPLLVSLTLRASGVVSGWVSVGLAVVMSLVSSTAGSAYWRRHGRGEVLFGELLLWGWIRSRRQERELANATRLLDLVNTGGAPRHHSDELSIEQREHLLQQLAGALEGQDVYLNGHSHRVARHATMIARGMGLSAEEVARIRAAAAVHDVGKLRTPKAILNKPGRLTDAEFEVIKRHPVDGADMVAALGDPDLTRIVRHHHERLDGAGYPDRLRGEEIPLGARIIAVADTFDAITSARPYRPAAPHQKAIDILRKEAGTQLDPDAVKAFLAYYSGSRATVVWAVITSSLRRVASWLTGDPAAAATISASKVAAATAVTAAIGAAAGAAPVPVVHHQRSRPAVAHRIHGAPNRSTASVPARKASVASASAGHATPRRAKPAATKAQRRGAHPTAAASRHRKQPSAGKHAYNRTAGPGAGSHPVTGAPRGEGGANASTPVASNSARTTGQSAGSHPVNAAAPATHRAAGTTHSTQSQGSNANGNAYGHTKVLGNGHGNGQAKGHAPATRATPSTPAAPTHSAPAPAVPSSTPSSAGGTHGSGNGNSNGNGHSSASAAPSVVAAPVTVPVPAPTTAASQSDQGNGNGNGNGHGG